MVNVIVGMILFFIVLKVSMGPTMRIFLRAENRYVGDHSDFIGIDLFVLAPGILGEQSLLLSSYRFRPLSKGPAILFESQQS